MTTFRIRRLLLKDTLVCSLYREMTPYDAALLRFLKIVHRIETLAVDFTMNQPTNQVGVYYLRGRIFELLKNVNVFLVGIFVGHREKEYHHE